MTVETQDANGQPVTQSGPYAGNGVTVSFDFDFPVEKAEAVRVLVESSTGTETVLTLTTDYTVDLGGPAGGSITLTDAALAPTGSKVIIQYRGDFNQSAAISNQGNLNLSVLEDALDKLTMHLRQLKNEVDRAVRVSAFDDASALEQLRSNIATAASISNEIVTAAANIGAIIAAPDAATAAANSATAAAASETAAANSATAAAASQTAAANSATAAAASETAAANSATAADGSADAAADSATLAHAWAQNPEDVEVAPGEFSARHWAAKAQAAASGPDFATQAQAEAGTNNDTVMTPLRTTQNVTARLSSQAAAEAGTDNTTLMTPLRTAQAIAAQASGGAVTGDMRQSLADLSAEGWLRADGREVSKTAYADLYALIGDQFAPFSEGLPALDVPLPGNGNGAAVHVSPSGVVRMAWAHYNSPYVSFYELSGDNPIKLPNPADLPSYHAWDVAWSADGTHVVVGHQNAPYFMVYSFDGTTFTKLPNPTDLPPGPGMGCAINEDGTLIAISVQTANPGERHHLYSRSGTTLTKLPGFETAITAGYGKRIGMSRDGSVIARASNNSSAGSFISIRRDDGTYKDFDVTEGTGKLAAAVNPSGTLAVAGGTVYRVFANGVAVLGKVLSTEAAFATDTALYATDGSKITLYSVVDGVAPVDSISVPNTLSLGAAATNSEENRLAVGTNDGTVSLRAQHFKSAPTAGMFALPATLGGKWIKA